MRSGAVSARSTGCLFLWVVVGCWFGVPGAGMLWKFLKGSVIDVVGIV